MFTPVIVTIPMLVLPLLMPPTRDCQFGRMGDPAADERALTAFEVAVNDYVNLHRRLERAWPPSWFIAGLEPTEIAAMELRAALRDARPQAVQGGLFTPEAADVFRFRIAIALREQQFDLAAMTSRLDEAGWWKPVVNEPLPWGVSGVTWPVFSTLPPLAPELEYRFIGRDLVLLDVHANLVVDMLDLALPASTRAADAEEPIAPFGEEPAGCWDEIDARE
jgi:hypothetical protein